MGKISLIFFIYKGAIMSPRTTLQLAWAKDFPLLFLRRENLLLSRNNDLYSTFDCKFFTFFFCGKLNGKYFPTIYLLLRRKEERKTNLIFLCCHLLKENQDYLSFLLPTKWKQTKREKMKKDGRNNGLFSINYLAGYQASCVKINTNPKSATKISID